MIAHDLLPTPRSVKTELSVSTETARNVAAARKVVADVIRRRDHRLLVVLGPCSIHDVDAGTEYATKLKALASRVDHTLLLVMRAYFEKPRTTVGWKGLINDPFLDDSFQIEHGIRLARKFLLEVAHTGLPLSTEALDPITPQYLQDLVSWSAIGARTTESQTHREMASGLSSAVGFKNGTEGGMQTAINALKSATTPHRFLGINQSGQVSVIHTAGNDNAHIVLRGGDDGPNFDRESIARCEDALQQNGLPTNIMVDCSHANSDKDYQRQSAVAHDVAEQIVDGNRSIMGLMLESNLKPGRQDLVCRDDLRYGVSITDGCIGWQETQALVLDLADRLREPLLSRHSDTKVEAA